MVIYVLSSYSIFFRSHGFRVSRYFTPQTQLLLLILTSETNISTNLII